MCIPFVYLLSIFPFSWLYFISNGFYRLIYKVFKYRIKITSANLRNSFPEKSETEIQITLVKFYRYFSDLILETIKMISVNKRILKNRVQINNVEILKSYYKNNQSVILVMGHFGNWELIAARLSLENLHEVYAIYHPLSNLHFNRLIFKMRSRFGTKLIPMKNTVKQMLENKAKLTATLFIADQTPSPKNAIWTTFLNQDTPVFSGTEKLAKKMNSPVIYLSISRDKRGYYTINPILIAEKPIETVDGEITKLHTLMLENDIKSQAEIWLWTHRRWKHKRENKI